MIHAGPLVFPAQVLENVGLSGGIAKIQYENVGSGPLPFGIATSGQAFARGELPAGSSLYATIGGAAANVQLDVKTTYEDGSVKFGVLAVERPALAAGQTVDVVLAAGPRAAPMPSVDYLAGLAAHRFNVALTGTDGVTHNINVLEALRDALADGTATWWMKGPLVGQARVEVLVDSSLRTVFDVSVYKDGEITVRQQINNDLSLGEVGGRATYDVTLKLDGQEASTQRVDQGQYQNWHNDFSSNASNGGLGHGDASGGWLNIRTDIGHLQAANIIADYDLTVRVDEALLVAWGKSADAFGWNDALSSHEVTQYMPGTGGRADIGFTTEANAAWLMSGDVRAATFAMGQAEAAGAVPWHFWDPRVGMFLNINDYPNIWTDGRGGTGSSGDPNSGGLSQPPDDLTGWSLDSAHQPDLSFVPYLLTGQRWILDNLNAQAAWNVIGQYPPVRGETDDLVVLENQVRGAAWSLRQIDESAWASPDGTPEKAYFTSVSDHNWSWLVAQIPRWTAEQGEVHGWVPGVYGTPGAMPPWQQDYFASTAIAAANRGNAAARTFLEWQSNFLIGRFTHAADGFAKHDGVAYLIANTDPSTGVPYTTWAELGAATVARGFSNGDGWSQSQGDYAQLGLATLAGLAEILGSRAAADAYYTLLDDMPPYTTAGDFARDPTFAVAPPDLGGSANDFALSIVLGADIWDGNPIAVVLVDGVEAFRGEIAALHIDGGAVLALGKVSGVPHVVTVQFLNDAWGGTSDTDRNLYVENILVNGLPTGQSAALTSAGAIEFAVSPPVEQDVVFIGSGANTIRIGLSGDLWRGWASFTVLLDGVVLVEDMFATAVHAVGATVFLDVRTNLGRAPHALTVRFGNDQFGGSTDTDRNLYVDSIAVDGIDQDMGAVLLKNGHATFVVVAASAPPPHSMVLPGGDGDDILTGNRGNDTLEAGFGDDTLDGGAGADSLVGGPGDDVYVVDHALDKLVELRLGGHDTVLAAISFTLPTELEDLILTGSAAINGTGNQSDNEIIGNAAANVLNGSLGADTLVGGGGNDLHRVDAFDVVVELPAGGIDTVSSAVSFSLDGMENVEVLQLVGSAGANATGNSGDNRILGNYGINVLTGGLGNDTLQGGAGDDTLRGCEGADSLFGGLGVDRLEGGGGDDIYVIADSDSIGEDANAGIDLVRASVSFTLGGDVENLTLTGAAAINGTGNTLANVLLGNGFANLLDGLGGADSLSGGNANDTLIGGVGADTLTGGAASDTFRYAAVAERGDLITDYRAVDDLIEVSAAGFGGGLVTGMNLSTAGRYLSNPTGLSDAARGQFVFETDARTLWWDADGTGPGGRFAIATFVGLNSLAASEILVIA